MPRARSLEPAGSANVTISRVRSYLFEAVSALLTRVLRWCKLKAWGHRPRKRIGFKQAKIAVARKLAIILDRRRRDGTDLIWSSTEIAA